ncbi:MAG: phosphoglucosamine mutase [Acidimicrobiales bacterium]
MRARFGTDGLRGLAGEVLTAELAVGLGRAAAVVLGDKADVMFLGRDTRVSGSMLSAAFASGVAAQGLDVIDLGVVPTPYVAFVSAGAGAPGAVVSASHNPFADNGIKLFAAGGLKLSEREEAAVEQRLHSGVAARLSGERIGRVIGGALDLRGYVDKLTAGLEGRSLRGARVVLDAANGAAVTTAETVFTAAGATVVEVVGARPDGTNINSGCGSNDTQLLSEAVRRTRATLGLAFDGDADRVVAVDEGGAAVDGDRLLAMLAADLQSRGRLAGNGVAVTVMSNLGLHEALRDLGVHVEVTQVGDRNILEALARRGWSLGGEQSGHIVFPDLATTGDGVLTGLLLVDLVLRHQRPLSELAADCMRSFPQVMINVEVSHKERLEAAQEVWSEVAALQGVLEGRGRVVVRPSGTENLVRVMVEADTDQAAAGGAERLAAVVARALGSAAG